MSKKDDKNSNPEYVIASAILILEKAERTTIESPWKIKMLVQEALEVLKAHKND
jgi:hypothetical protein